MVSRTGAVRNSEPNDDKKTIIHVLAVGPLNSEVGYDKILEAAYPVAEAD